MDIFQKVYDLKNYSESDEYCDAYILLWGEFSEEELQSTEIYTRTTVKEILIKQNKFKTFLENTIELTPFETWILLGRIRMNTLYFDKRI